MTGTTLGATPVAIRPMTAADTIDAAELIVRGGWGDRREFFAWAVGHAGTTPLVATIDGAIVGTGVGSVHGPVGWVGTIFVDEALRGRGLGAELTRRVIAGLEAAGCASLVLIATELGRPIYERLGFRVDGHYHMLSTAGLAADDPAAAEADGVRPVEPDDLAELIELDARAIGEDRSGIVRSFAGAGRSVVATDAAGRIVASLVRPPWGAGALIAPDPADALRLLAWRRREAGPDGRVGAGLPSANEGGRAILADAGWVEGATPVRMVRGEAPAWQPAWIWGQFGGPLG